LVSITVSLRDEIYDRLREYCKKNGVRPSTVIAKLIEVALPVLEEQEKKEVKARA